MLLAMPVAVAMREAWPGVKVFMVVEAFVQEAIAESPHLDGVVVFDKKLHRSGGPVRQLVGLIRWLRLLRSLRCDVVLDLHGSPQSALWTRATGAAVRVGRRRRYRTWAYTIVLRGPPPTGFGGEGLNFLPALGLDPPPWHPVPVGRSPDVDAAVGRTLADLLPDGRRVVLMNLGGGWPSKLWPAEHFATLARTLSEAGLANVLLAWAPGEEARRDRVVELACGHARALPSTDLRTLAAYLKAADLVITNDTGPKHMAVGEGTPTLTLYGSTDPTVWEAPVRGNRWVSNPTPCSPCHKTECFVPGHPCLTGLRPGRVMREVVEMLEDLGPRPTSARPPEPSS